MDDVDSTMGPTPSLAWADVIMTDPIFKGLNLVIYKTLELALLKEG